tara:strand:+ start:95 stop:220 length:126 start_codon:yes stop_codon:yes gene_type:complete
MTVDVYEANQEHEVNPNNINFDVRRYDGTINKLEGDKDLVP